MLKVPKDFVWSILEIKGFAPRNLPIMASISSRSMAIIGGFYKKDNRSSILGLKRLSEYDFKTYGSRDIIFVSSERDEISQHGDRTELRLWSA